MPPLQHSPARYVAMKDSWSHGEDRRDRGRLDRGVTRQRRSRSPPSRRPENEREPKGIDRSPVKSKSFEQRSERPRDRSHDRRRRPSRSPIRDSREEVRERNRGRELLDTRGTDKPKRSHQSPSSSKRRKSRSPSPAKSHHKKSRRGTSRSPPRLGGGFRASSRSDKKRRTLSPLPPRKRSPDRRHFDIRGDGKTRHRRDSIESDFDRRDRSPGSRHSKDSRPARKEFVPRHDSTLKRYRSPPSQHPNFRNRSPFEKSRGGDWKREKSPSYQNRRPSDLGRYDPKRSRPQSPRAHKRAKSPRGDSPIGEKGGRPPQEGPAKDESHQSPGESNPKGGQTLASALSGANSVEDRGARPSPAASGANSIQVKSEKMAGRGYYGGQPGYSANNQMQAAFPLKPQYDQQPDPRQYSQSPQHHMTPNSYHGSPQAQSPYSAGRGNWGNQQQFSPQPQYAQNYPQPTYSNPNAPQGHYYNNQSHSPQYQGANGPPNQGYNQQNFRGNQRGYRGNNFNPRAAQGDRRGRGGSHFQNLHWNANNASSGPGRGQHNSSGNATPQHTSPQQHYPSQASHESTPQHKPVAEQDEEDTEDLFRPSKALQIEDKEVTKNKDEEEMPPPSRPTPTGPQSQQNSSKFSFAFKASSKTTAAQPKPEISQKLNAAPVRRDPNANQPRSQGPTARQGTSEAGPSRHPPTTRKIKKKMKREKKRPQLDEEFYNSDSVYYRKPGNESVVGSGTYGKVFKAIHVYTRDLVALKKIRMEGERDGFPVTAVREIKLLQSLKHPNIVNLQEVMVEKNDCFMVFEYLSHDLTGLLNHPSFKLEPSHKKHLAKQLFEGLDYLHRKGVLHRDIKAANILVSSDGELKLADFGLARFYAKRRQLDYTNRVITIWYRSPELLLGETQYGPAVDIWSAACVLVEIFTRHAIFPGDGGEISQLEKIYAILGTPNKAEWPGLADMAWFELLRPSARRPNVFAEKYKDRVTPAAFELLEAMFLYDPAKRPSASDVLEHPYFTTEEPKPKQAIELAKLDGEWHEFESKALRKENERKDKEARRQAQKDAAVKAEKEKKRGPEGEVAEREPKRAHTGPPSMPASNTTDDAQ